MSHFDSTAAGIARSRVSEPPGSYSEFRPMVTSERLPSRNCCTTEKMIQPTDCNNNSQPMDSCTSGGDNLSVLLADIEDVITFAKLRFLKRRMTTLSTFKDNLKKNNLVLEAAECRLVSLEELIKESMFYICCVVSEWNKRKSYYTKALTINCGPDIQTLCPKLTQQSYVELVEKMVQLCGHVESKLSQAGLKLANMEQTSVAVRKVIQQSRQKVEVNYDKVGKLVDEQYVAIYSLLEKAEQDVNMFKGELQKGGWRQKPPSSRLFTLHQFQDEEDAQAPSPRTKNFSGGVTVPQAQKGPVLVFPHRASSCKPQGGLQDIVDRYNALYHTVLDKMRNKQDQQTLINRNNDLNKPI